ncbi:MAG: ABC-F family ATP-binding cassette domain-containing protein [Bacteroidetes bacterium]|nr:ABC-F family ATP-binding cassette domain-containing protein [Bacteroidota bacterium]
MLTFQDVSFDFAGRMLYQDVNWQISEGQRIGLVGKNGTGKSTLLRLMIGEYSPTTGTLSRSKDLNIGFLNQDLLSFESNASILEVAQLGFKEAHKLEQEIEALLQKLEHDQSEEVLNELADKQQRFEVLGGYEMEARAHEVLNGLGFNEAERQRAFSSFSGGWRMRVMLAQILLGQPQLLLLDEPTNHLDLPSIEWIENYLQGYRGTYIVVSHDRFFLDRMVSEVVEVLHKRLHFYTGNYTRFLEQKEERMAIHKSAYENQQRFINESERFINRFRAKATKASQAQSRMKMLDKLDRIEAPESDEATMSLRFDVAVNPGADILSLKQLNKHYDDLTILHGAEATVRRGDKIGLIGANGTGKSTVLRILAHTESFEGERKEGYNVQATFFAQHQLESLKLANTLLEELRYHAPDKTDTYLRTILGCFLFSGDDVDKKIKVLSGGEKSRVALAKTLVTRANFLLLDEPTNHLDIQSIEILMEALKNYAGSYVVISHDRFFLRNVTNKVWYIEGQQIKEYPGTFAEFEEWQALNKNKVPATAPKPAPAAKVEKTPEPAPKAPAGATDTKEAKKLENRIKTLENRIADLESQKQALQQQMTGPEFASDFTKLAALQKQHTQLDTELEQHLAEWETTSEALDALRQQA